MARATPQKRAKEKAKEKQRFLENQEKDREKKSMEKIPKMFRTKERGKETKERAKETKEKERARTTPKAKGKKAKGKMPTPLNMLFSQPHSRQSPNLAKL